MTAYSVTIDEKRFESARGEDLLAISQLEFEVEENQFTCIVGPSGCGKTTALRIILGLEKEYQGNVSALAQHRTAAVFQEPRLMPWRTVRQNVDLCVEAALAGSMQLDTANDLRSLFQKTGLDAHLDFYPSELSLGLARRVAITRAFAIQPELLILDEPFVSLDDATAVRLRQLLIAVWESRPTTVLMVTHNLHEAAVLADKVVVLSGRPSKVLGNIEIAQSRDSRDVSVVNETIALIEEMQATDVAY